MTSKSLHHTTSDGSTLPQGLSLAEYFAAATFGRDCNLGERLETIHVSPSIGLKS
jgi:hypothetical protein